MKIKDAMNKERNVREGEEEARGNQREPSFQERSLTRRLWQGRGTRDEGRETRDEGFGEDFAIIS
jgi:hypothetical protein